MESVLRVILKRYQISNAVWTKDEDGRMYQVSKCCFVSPRAEQVQRHSTHRQGVFIIGTLKQI